MIRKSFIISTSIVLGVILGGCGSGGPSTTPNNNGNVDQNNTNNVIIGGGYNEELLKKINAFRGAPQVCGSTTEPATTALSQDSSTQYTSELIAKKVANGELSLNSDFERREAKRVGLEYLNQIYSNPDPLELFGNVDIQDINNGFIAAVSANPDMCRKVMNPKLVDMGYFKQDDVEILLLAGDEKE